MNYRHRFHAGNFADVMKHVLQIQLFRALQQKDRGILFLDTHAGRGRYDLTESATGDRLPRAPEWPEGIGRLWGRPDLPPPLEEYLETVRSVNRLQRENRGELIHYPGSPWIARALARTQDRLAFCEKHPDEVEALRQEFSLTPHCSVQALDGYTALRAMLPPPERRALTLIDPPYESREEWAALLAGMTQALQRFPAGVYAIWYPITERAALDNFLVGLKDLGPPPTLMAELIIAGPATGLKMPGCGLVIVNPPWQFEAAAVATLDFLAKALGRDGQAAGRVSWLQPEK